MILQGGAQTDDTGQVHGAGLEAVGHGHGHFFFMRSAACTAGDQRCGRLDHVIAQQHTADTLGAQQALMACETEGINVAGFHIDGESTCLLGAVKDKLEAMLMADSADLFDGQESTADIGCCRHNNCLGVGTDELLNLCGIQGAVLGTLGNTELYAQLLHLNQRTHNSIVLHRTGDDMIAGLQKALN